MGFVLSDSNILFEIHSSVWKTCFHAINPYFWITFRGSVMFLKFLHRFNDNFHNKPTDVLKGDLRFNFAWTGEKL